MENEFIAKSGISFAALLYKSVGELQNSIGSLQDNSRRLSGPDGNPSYTAALSEIHSRIFSVISVLKGFETTSLAYDIEQYQKLLDAEFTEEMEDG